MTAIVSTIFHIILFPLDENVVTVYQLSFFATDYSLLPSGSKTLVGGVPNSYINIGTSLLKASSLTGCFPLLPPAVPQMVNMVSSIPHDLTDPWILLAPSDINTYREQMPLSPTDLAYQAIQSSSESLATLVTTNGTVVPPIIVSSFDPLNQVLPIDEAIREIMSLEE